MKIYFELLKSGESFELPEGMSLMGSAIGEAGCGLVYTDAAKLDGCGCDCQDKPSEPVSIPVESAPSVDTITSPDSPSDASSSSDGELTPIISEDAPQVA